MCRHTFIFDAFSAVRHLKTLSSEVMVTRLRVNRVVLIASVNLALALLTNRNELFFDV